MIIRIFIRHGEYIDIDIVNAPKHILTDLEVVEIENEEE